MRDQITVPAALAATLDPAERARWELAAMAGRLRTLEARLAETQLQAQRLRRERDRLRDGDPRPFVGLLRTIGRRLRRIPLRRGLGHGLREGRDRGVHRKRAGRRELVQAVARPALPAAITVDTLPSRLYVAVGLGAGAVRDFVQTVQQRVLVSPDHRPVVLTDDPDLAPLGDHGVLVEYVPDRDTWDRHRPDLSWDEVLVQRLARLSRDHGIARTLVVDRSCPPTLADLLR
jgi:hypothetical protein